MNNLSYCNIVEAEMIIDPGETHGWGRVSSLKNNGAKNNCLIRYRERQRWVRAIYCILLGTRHRELKSAHDLHMRNVMPD